MEIIPRILMKITGKPRYDRNMPWFSDSITGNLFRLWEKIVWKKYGVKIEASQEVFTDDDGITHTTFVAHTFEALVIHSEYSVRRYFKGVIQKAKLLKIKFRLPTFAIFDIFQPQFAFEGIRIVPNLNNPEGYAFAITFGNSAADQDQGSGTTSFNNNGDFLYMGVNSTNNTITAATYNSASMTEIGTQYYTTWPARYHNTFGKTSPSSGTYDIVVDAGANWQFIALSASGVDQTTPTSGLTLGTDASSGANPTLAITTTVASAFAIASGQIQGTPSAGTDTTQVLYGGGAFGLWRSTNAVSPAGAFTVAITATSGGYRLRGFGLNPPQSGPANLKSLDTNVKANIKSYNTNVIANIKSVNTNV